MYIQITTKCNMTCGHCCFACEPGKGEDMSFEMFSQILDKWGGRIARDNKWIVLGGGEPTLHPEFWKMVTHALSYGHTWTATNGAITEDALKLARMAERGVLWAVLSLDKWHDPIDPVVVDAFKNGLSKHQYGYKFNKSNSKDKRQIRSVTEPKISGNTKEGLNSCPCRGVQIRPDGTIYSCGCETAIRIGTVETGIMEKYQSASLYDGCYKDWVGV